MQLSAPVASGNPSSLVTEFADPPHALAMQRCWMKSCLVAAHVLHMLPPPSSAESSLPASDRGQSHYYCCYAPLRPGSAHADRCVDQRAPDQAALGYCHGVGIGRSSAVAQPRQRMHLSGKTWRGRIPAGLAIVGAISQHAQSSKTAVAQTAPPFHSSALREMHAPFLPERTRTHSPSKPPTANFHFPRAPADCDCVRSPVMRASLSAQLHSLNAFMRRLASATACDSLRSSHALLTPLGARSTLLVPPWQPVHPLHPSPSTHTPLCPSNTNASAYLDCQPLDCRLEILLAICLVTPSEAFAGLWPALGDTRPPLPTPSKAAVAPDTLVTTPSKLDLSYHAIGAFCPSLPCDASPYLSQQIHPQ
ncbi:hypothetical protein BM1_08503 [Bipolaris maydis]|nr:hypothetical protein BM1_08503 [Bipolaris maydis]